MGHCRDMAGLTALLAVAGALALPASAQTPTPWGTNVKQVTAAKSAPDIASGAQSYEEGLKAYTSGQHALAIEKFTLALSSKALKPGQTAHALYYRGVAYRAIKRPDLAITDLTNALLKKGLLNEQERADALQHRAAAFRDAGHSDQADPPEVKQASRVRATQGEAPRITAAIPQAAPGPAPMEPPAPSSGGVLGFVNALFAPQQQPAPAIAAAPAPAQTPSGPWVTTGSTGGQRITPTPAQPQPAQQVAIAAPVAVQPAPKAQPMQAGAPAWRLQLAAQRDKKAAETALAKAKAKYAALGKRQAAIEPANVGGMGAFWLTRVGPFADQREAQDLCAAIRADGVDCFVSSD